MVPPLRLALPDQAETLRPLLDALCVSAGGRSTQRLLEQVADLLRVLDPASLMRAARIIGEAATYRDVGRSLRHKVKSGSAIEDVDGAAAWMRDAFLSNEWSGFMRQSAVESLGERLRSADAPTSRVLLAFLTIRLNDWVPQVREAASRALMGFMDSADPEVLAWSLPLAVPLRVQSRADHGPILRAWARALSNEDEGHGPLAEIFASGDAAQQRAAVQVLGDIESPDWRRWADRLLAHPDPWMSLRGIAIAQDRLRGAGTTDALLGLMGHPIPTIRARALRVLALETVREEAVTESLRAALWDTGRSVRTVAQFHLAKEVGREALAKGYAAELGAPRRRRRLVAICGLGETGSAADAQRLNEALEHETGRLAAAALQGLSSLLPEPPRDVLIRCVGSSDASVRAAASRLLEHEIFARDEGWVTESLGSAMAEPFDPARTKVLLRLTNRLRWDDRLRLVASVPLADVPVSDRLDWLELLSQRLKRISLDVIRRAQRVHPPTPANLQSIQSSLVHLEGVVPASVLESVRWLTQPDAWTHSAP